jgi:outer membrane protein assembly factor BamE (lipoprotein component of BamABCDE complex)
MRQATAHGATLLAAALLCACTTTPHPPIGRDFAKAAFAGFVLDRTTLGEVEAVLGPPMRQANISGIAKPDAKGIVPGTRFTFVRLDYWFAPSGLKRPLKEAELVFFDDRMVQFSRFTSLPSEVSQPVDPELLTRLRQGQTTRAQAILLLGTPTGETLHKFDSEHGSSELLYGWTQRIGGMVEQKNLLLFFDKYERLTSYTLLENSYPEGSPPMPMPSPPSQPDQAAPPGEPVPGSRPDLNHT